jgi:hypothetical protein
MESRAYFCLDYFMATILSGSLSDLFRYFFAFVEDSLITGAGLPGPDARAALEIMLAITKTEFMELVEL